MEAPSSTLCSVVQLSDGLIAGSCEVNKDWFLRVWDPTSGRCHASKKILGHTGFILGDLTVSNRITIMPSDSSNQEFQQWQ